MAVKVQHLRSSTAVKRPTTTALLAGELSINTNAGTPGVFFENANGGIVKVGPAEIGSTAPNATPPAGGSSGNSAGEFWLDTANAGGNSAQALKIFDGASWDYIGSVTIGTTDIEVGSSGSTTLSGLSSISSTSITGTLQTASQTNITGLGTITTGTWNATTIGVAYGGTGLTTTPTNGQLLIGNGTGYTLATITGGTALTTTNGAGSITIDLDDTTVSPASYGGAGTVATFTVDQQGRLTAAAGVSINITHTQVSDFDAGVQTNRLDQMAAPTSDVSFNSVKITNLADPVGAQDAATKNYVDSVAQGLDVKASVRAATTGNITLSGEQTIDTVPLVSGDRVLVKDQSTPSQNGIYIVSTGSWSRSTDANTWDELISAFVFVESGGANADNGYVCTVDPGGTLGSTAVTWDQFSGAGQITAGDGLSKTGNTLDVNVDDVTLEIVADDLQIKSTYVGQTSITTLGTVTTGTWNATAIGLTYGGTGTNNTSVTQNYAFMGPNSGGTGNASFREILTSDIAPVTGGSFDAGAY